MKLEKEWFCTECGEKLTTSYFGDEYFGQCICENCFTTNDILEDWELQYDGIDREDSEKKEDTEMKECGCENNQESIIIREAYKLLSDIDNVLGISRFKAKESIVKKCITEFEMEMIDKSIKENSEFITIHLSDVTALKHEIDDILSL